jgi:hypothetical protein
MIRSYIDEAVSYASLSKQISNYPMESKETVRMVYLPKSFEESK